MNLCKLFNLYQQKLDKTFIILYKLLTLMMLFFIFAFILQFMNMRVNSLPNIYLFKLTHK